MVHLLKLETILRKMKLNLFIRTKFIFIQYIYEVHNWQLHKEDLAYNMQQVHLSVLHNNQGKDTQKEHCNLFGYSRYNPKEKLYSDPTNLVFKKNTIFEYHE